MANHGAAIVGASLLVRGPLWCGDRESHEKAAEIRPFDHRHYFSRLGGGAVGVSSLLAATRRGAGDLCGGRTLRARFIGIAPATRYRRCSPRSFEQSFS